jgi:hypothetical protein
MPCCIILFYKIAPCHEYSMPLSKVGVFSHYITPTRPTPSAPSRGPAWAAADCASWEYCKIKSFDMSLLTNVWYQAQINYAMTTRLQIYVHTLTHLLLLIQHPCCLAYSFPIWLECEMQNAKCVTITITITITINYIWLECEMQNVSLSL